MHSVRQARLDIVVRVQKSDDFSTAICMHAPAGKVFINKHVSRNRKVMTVAFGACSSWTYKMYVHTSTCKFYTLTRYILRGGLSMLHSVQLSFFVLQSQRQGTFRSCVLEAVMQVFVCTYVYYVQ